MQKIENDKEFKKFLEYLRKTTEELHVKIFDLMFKAYTNKDNNTNIIEGINTIEKNMLVTKICIDEMYEKLDNIGKTAYNFDDNNDGINNLLSETQEKIERMKTNIENNKNYYDSLIFKHSNK